MAFTHVDRFSQPTRDALKVLEDDLVDFAARMTHLLSVLQELNRVRRERAFLVYHEPVYQMLRSERDMLVIDLDSWALHLHEKGGGGLLSTLSGQDLDALQLEWTGGYPPTISVDGAEHPEESTSIFLRSIERGAGRPSSACFHWERTGPKLGCPRAMTWRGIALSSRSASVHFIATEISTGHTDTNLAPRPTSSGLPWISKG